MRFKANSLIFWIKYPKVRMLKFICSLSLFVVFLQSQDLKLNKYSSNKIESYENSFIQNDRYKFYFSNSGDIGGAGANVSTYDGFPVIFIGGSWLSGYYSDTLFVNGQLISSLNRDYLPGKAGSDPTSLNNKIYTVKTSDIPFGESWVNWISAVELGAGYYDGDDDGVYSPVDKNLNGKWDPDEDKPEIFGDITSWFVANDGQPSNLRRFREMFPLGIEIYYTIYAFPFSGIDALRNSVFFRLKVKNTGKYADRLSGVILSFVLDADIGDYTDDYSGSDLERKGVLTYNFGIDSEFGSNPPAVFSASFLNPHYYKPDVTFIDINSNGLYDEGVDTPLDSAYYKSGIDLPDKYIRGAANTEIKSTMNFLSSHPLHGDPVMAFQQRNFQKGLDKNGNIIDPCTWVMGTVTGVPCSEINPYFYLNGDPVTNTGWLCNYDSDQKMLFSTAEFDLFKDNPVELHGAIVFGRGSDHLNSIEVVRDNFDVVKDYFNSEPGFPLNIEDKNSIYTVKDYVLYQNYPNPVLTGKEQSISKFSFEIEREGTVSLKIFDITGNEILEIFDGQLQPGKHTFTVDFSDFTSGVYFYMFKSNGNREIKKLTVIK
ncbi:MAG: T9SS type A sorting domain-containing protein [Ignavibacteriaceae bacterium]|nr:T9SS type A sorting domain-containing protein [Ignavibacteriaceae bacterium]